jgi:hypothetical protein
MKFRTEVEIPISEKKIQISDSLFSIGSCFATEISVKLSDSQFQTLNNPFGTLFNPWAVKNSIQEIFENKIYTEEDLDFHQGEYLSFNHHTSFNSENQKDTLRKINEKINLAHEFLKRSNWVIITYGTAFVYEHLAQNIFVANCHKIPQTNFNKRLLTHEELVNSITETCHILKKISPKEAQILFTLSPVRHTKDGFSENNLSKAKLLCAIHEVVEQHENCRYIPVYEIVMDDLRDYRFYKEDLIHPSEQAVQYIWEKFKKAYFSDEADRFSNENLKIKQALEHRPKDKNSPKHQTFLKQLQEKIMQQQGKVGHKIFTDNLDNFL